MTSFKVAIVGCGNIAGYADDDPKKRHIYSHVKAILSFNNLTISCCCDIDKDAANNFANRYKIKNVYNNFENMLASEKIDILVICTPTSKHFENVKFALFENVKVIFCEKPLTIKLNDGIQLVQIANQNNKLLLVNFMRRWDNFYEECKILLESRELGRIETIVAYVDTALFMNASHMLDLLIYFGGDVHSVVGFIDKLNKTRIVHGIKDFGAIATIKHKNGIVSFIKATGESKRNHFYEMDFQCTKGRLRILNDDMKYEVYKFQDSPQQSGQDELFLQSIKENKDEDERMINAYTEIIDYLEKGKIPSYLASESLKSLEVIDLIYKSDAKNHFPVYSAF